MILGKIPSFILRIPIPRPTFRRAAIDMGDVLSIFVTALIAVVLAGPFERQATLNLVNYSGGASAIGGQLPLFYILLIVAIVIGPVAMAFRKLS